jgi:hypothetical protein
MNKCRASETQLRHLQILVYLSWIARNMLHLFNLLDFEIRTVQLGVQGPVFYSFVSV